MIQYPTLLIIFTWMQCGSVCLHICVCMLNMSYITTIVNILKTEMVDRFHLNLISNLNITHQSLQWCLIKQVCRSGLQNGFVLLLICYVQSLDSEVIKNAISCSSYVKHSSAMTNALPMSEEPLTEQNDSVCNIMLA